MYTFIGEPSPDIDWSSARSYAVIETVHGDIVKIPISNSVPKGRRTFKLDKAIFEGGNRLAWIEVDYKPSLKAEFEVKEKVNV